MPVIGEALLAHAPIKDMLTEKCKFNGVSHGLSEVGYDIRVKQTIIWTPPDIIRGIESGNPEHYLGFTEVVAVDGSIKRNLGRTALASSIEKFQMPPVLWGELRNKSTHAREFVDATRGTDVEPGWEGWLTIEIVFDGLKPLTILGGSGILKAVFHPLSEEAFYKGKYQNQADMPVPPIYE